MNNLGVQDDTTWSTERVSRARTLLVPQTVTVTRQGPSSTHVLLQRPVLQPGSRKLKATEQQKPNLVHSLLKVWFLT